MLEALHVYFADTADFVVKVIIICLGLFLTHWLITLRERRKAELDMITERLNRFYGPFLIAQRAAHIAYAGLKQEMLGIDSHSELRAQSLSSEQKQKWKVFMKKSLWPLNEIREDVILKNVHLARLSTSETHKELLAEMENFVAHNAEWRSIISRWESGDDSQLFPFLAYDRGDLLEERVRNEFDRLSNEREQRLSSRFSRRLAW